MHRQPPLTHRTERRLITTTSQYNITGQRPEGCPDASRKADIDGDGGEIFRVVSPQTSRAGGGVPLNLGVQMIKFFEGRWRGAPKFRGTNDQI